MKPAKPRLRKGKEYAPRPWRMTVRDKDCCPVISDADGSFVLLVSDLNGESHASLIRRARLICRAVNGWKGK